ncbi:MAG: hypothetical protein J5666_00215 [Bacilli bacterium]|nr:hypothetical protein [Bacilli bacterium]
MKIYAIRDKENIYGYIFSRNDYGKYYIEINDDVKEHGAFFHMFLEKGKKVINTEWSRRYVEERAIPSNRQNINSILKNDKMKYYNELLIFIKAKGKSSMDDYYLEDVLEENVVGSVQERREKRILDFILDRNKLIIFFMDGLTKEYKITDEYEQKYIQNEEPFLSIFGEEIIFNSRIRYTYEYLYENGEMFDLSYDSIKKYISTNVLKTSDVASTLDCSRQYVHQLMEKEELKSMSNETFLKNDIRRFMGD